jgi:putative PIN family toxin of toxin-antitoxin system
MLRSVLDTNVLIKARRSRTGASNALLRAAGEHELRMLVSVPLFFEYEAVLKKPQHLIASRLNEREVSDFLDYMAGFVETVRFHYLWRPQLSDVADEMVLEKAIDGRADCIVTFNIRHFGPPARFGIETIWPAEAIRRIR